MSSGSNVFQDALQFCGKVDETLETDLITATMQKFNPKSSLNSSFLDWFFLVRTLQILSYFYRMIKYGIGLGLGPHLFVKVPRPGDSEVTFAVFESSCHLLLPV